MIPYVREMKPQYGIPVQVSPNLRRIVCNNPGPFTFLGTNTYIIGHGEIAVIDPGPLLPSHIENLKQTLKNEHITHILLTHTHLDHSPAAKPLKKIWGTKTYAFGPHGSGKTKENVKVEEGGDMDFIPDKTIQHGDIIKNKNWTIECVYTPGHTSNHMCFCLQEEKALITGDHLMGWSTSVIAPPDGDMDAYMNSLRLLLNRDDKVFWPAHGPPVHNTRSFTKAFIKHRETRENAILKSLKTGNTKIPDMVKEIYKDVDKRLHPAACLSVLAHMESLVKQNRVLCKNKPTISSKYQLNEK